MGIGIGSYNDDWHVNTDGPDMAVAIVKYIHTENPDLALRIEQKFVPPHRWVLNEKKRKSGR